MNSPYFDNAVNFSGHTACHIIKNAVEQETGVGIYLGEGTSGCQVVCASPADIVTNAGTDNRLVACTLKR